MARIFWITCPKCLKKFYAATDDFRGKKDRMLRCPFCEARFNDEACDIIE